MKECTTCHEIKPTSEFYRHKGMSDGHLSKCKNCVKTRVRGHRADNEHVREYDRLRYQSNPDRRERTRQTTRAWNKRNPEAYRAHYTLTNAVRDGRINRGPCEVCGDVKVHGHHDDYTKPLEVRWLCARHHAVLHAPDKRTD